MATTPFNHEVDDFFAACGVTVEEMQAVTAKASKELEEVKANPNIVFHESQMVEILEKHLNKRQLAVYAIHSSMAQRVHKLEMLAAMLGIDCECDHHHP
jgi:superfamily II DNA/RNA helicase